jgi:hypothetical protein
MLRSGRIFADKVEAVLQLGRLPENGIPDRTGFSFVIKARQQAHSRSM